MTATYCFACRLGGCDAAGNPAVAGALRGPAPSVRSMAAGAPGRSPQARAAAHSPRPWLRDQHFGVHTEIRGEALDQTEQSRLQLLGRCRLDLLVADKVPELLKPLGEQRLQHVPLPLWCVLHLPVCGSHQAGDERIQLLSRRNAVVLQVCVDLEHHAFEVLSKRLARPFVLDLETPRVVTPEGVPFDGYAGPLDDGDEVRVLARGPLLGLLLVVEERGRQHGHGPYGHRHEQRGGARGRRGHVRRRPRPRQLGRVGGRVPAA
mmetsp:Transcript_58482/g.166316  ORF Transcript_58482/g.166316 Transcript_58482/m.166316 type:complete len:263 (+) Transcript_58482:118-906(+)